MEFEDATVELSGRCPGKNSSLLFHQTTINECLDNPGTKVLLFTKQAEYLMSLLSVAEYEKHGNRIIFPNGSFIEIRGGNDDPEFVAEREERRQLGIAAKAMRMMPGVVRFGRQDDARQRFNSERQNRRC